MAIIEKISEAWSSWLEGLNAREKRMLGILSAGLVVVLALGTFYLAASKITHKRNNVTRSQNLLGQIRDLEGEYLVSKAKNEKIIESIRRNDISLLSMIPNVASRLGLTVKELTEQRRPLGKTSNVEVSVRISLAKLSMDKVTALIEAIETGENEGRVKVTRLKINTRFDEPDLLDVQMTVSTWKSA